MRRPLGMLPPLLVILTWLAAGCGGDDEPASTAPTTAGSATGPTGAAEPTGPAGGGGGGEGTSADEAGGGGKSSPRARARAALKGFFLSGDPALVCEELATDRLVRSAYGDREGCARAQQPEAVPRSVRVRALEVSGRKAEALVVPEGGPNDGIETEVALLRGGGGWQVDSLEADVPAGP